MPAILITGGTGLIGQAITRALVDKGYEVIILSRNPEQQKKSMANVSFAKWDIEKQVIDRDAVTKAGYIIHLAGANVAERRWTEKRKKEILESRVKSSGLLVKALKEIPNNIRAVISASAMGWYGPDKIPANSSFNESDPHFEDFLGQTSKKWEESIEPVTQLSKRLVILRTGIVLSNEGGAFVEFKKPLKFGLATILGSGKQVISWIHIDDLVRMYIAALENENLNGIYNAVAPGPVSNREFILKLAKEERKNFYIPIYIPSFVLKLLLGEMSIEVLKSATVSCKKIQASGFRFLYPTVQAAIENLTK
ncbi:MAG: hypothetical protein JWM28_4436 [Chitinophagaceae bacterium]|nr:hypothetical protein [Chitinophagaceae bacterium]